jgi:hypothetical protein
MVFSPPRSTTDPVVALRRIREQCPADVGSKKLLDLFYAVVIEDRQLHRAVIAQSFANALAALAATDTPP